MSEHTTIDNQKEREAFEAWSTSRGVWPMLTHQEIFGAGYKAAIDAALAARGAVPAGSGALSGKYGDVLAPFVTLMEAELHANSQKGDRPGWLTMSPSTGLLEIYWHTAKLSAAVKNNDIKSITEHSADVANMAMMLLDVCGGLAVAPQQVAQPRDRTALEQYDLEQSVDYRKGWDDGRLKGYEVGYRHGTEAHLFAQAKPEQAAQPNLLSWAVDRWLAEVSNRPLVNKNRRSLDDTWRQVIRFAGGDPDELIGPCHDTLLAAAPQKPKD